MGARRVGAGALAVTRRLRPGGSFDFLRGAITEPVVLVEGADFPIVRKMSF